MTTSIKSQTEACTPLNQQVHSVLTPESMNKASPCQSDKSTPIDSTDHSSSSNPQGEISNQDEFTTPIKKKNQRLAHSPCKPNHGHSELHSISSNTNQSLKSNESSPLSFEISPSSSAVESEEDLEILAFTSPIVDPRTNHFGRIRGGARLEDSLLEEVEGALNYLQIPSNRNERDSVESDLSSLTTKSTCNSDVCFTPSPSKSVQEKSEKQAIPEWRIKDGKEVSSSSNCELFSAFGSTRTPDKRVKDSPSSSSSNGTGRLSCSASPNNKCKGAWFNKTNSNMITPHASSETANLQRSPLHKASEMDSELKVIELGAENGGNITRMNEYGSCDDKHINKWFHLQRHAPHALHVHCAILKQKAPCPSLVSNASLDFECMYRLMNREGIMLTSFARCKSKARARNIAATYMLIQLYPEFHGNVLQIMKYLDQQLKEKNVNLRKVIMDENDVAHQEKTFKLIDEKVIKEGFNPVSIVNTQSPQEEERTKSSEISNDVESFYSSDQSFSYGPFPMFDQTTDLLIPLEEPVKVLNEVIHLKGFNYPTCRHKEEPTTEQNTQQGDNGVTVLKSHSPSIHSIIMVLETPKGVYFSEGKSLDIKQAKSECAWKMLNYLFPYLNGSWALIVNQVERLREQKRKEKLQKREQVFGAKRKLDFSNLMSTESSSACCEDQGTDHSGMSLQEKQSLMSSNSTNASADIPSCKSCAALPISPPHHNGGYPFYFISREGIPLQTQQPFPPHMMMGGPVYYPPPPPSQFYNSYAHPVINSNLYHDPYHKYHPVGFLSQHNNPYSPQHAGPVWFPYGGFQCQQPQPQQPPFNKNPPRFGLFQPSSRKNETNKQLHPHNPENAPQRKHQGQSMSPPRQ
ncbi:hypothetical protein FDP41_002879 [Naegleria fowleri]|uniref:Uncharacterized protein n=1 Tax=Naegleria fowleri TaxID=5763 RepID=A0A6A5BVR2_NAEFO|nr:uncharacterized protein FDP41_002879 [Naegleria fowleri]KAF0978364.1 hypothetical protein FDP41_002879 [Naegleria fowleri]